MMSESLFLAILFSATTLWSPSQPVRDVYQWKSHMRMQNKLKHLCRELVLDAEMKLKAVQHYRDQFYKSLPYQLGDIVYKLRDLFKQMINKYQLVDRNISYHHYDHNQNIRIFVEVRRMGTELETQVDMAREWQLRRRTAEEHHEVMKDPLRSGAGRDLHESEELLGEAVARGRMAQLRRGAWGARGRAARAGAGRPPAPPVLAGGATRKNKKWKRVVP